MALEEATIRKTTRAPRPGGKRTTLHVCLSAEDRGTLEGWLLSPRCPYGLHKRARAVLLLAGGVPVSEVARRVDLERRFVYKWVARFKAGGAAGLRDQPRHGPRAGRWRLTTEDT